MRLESAILRVLNHLLLNQESNLLLLPCIPFLIPLMELVYVKFLLRLLELLMKRLGDGTSINGS